MRERAAPTDEAALLNLRCTRANIGLLRRHPQRRLLAAHTLYRAAATGRRARHAARALATTCCRWGSIVLTAERFTGLPFAVRGG